MIRKSITVYGYVQGVGFRYRAINAAGLVGATGWVRNNPDGSVSMEIQGSEEQIDKVMELIAAGSYVEIERLDVKRIEVDSDERSFGVKD
ncbi:MAG: acylphosphatase [Lachnospiraceae bacterium]|nr:acylphosphatase [Lachnospiraceae bacterium]